MYVEEVSHKLSNRGKIIEAGTTRPIPRDFEYYISLFPYDNTIVDYVKINGTVKGHKGKHACSYIIFDIDNEDDLQRSKSDALDLLNRFQSEYGLSPDDTWIYFSGCKGFHIIITPATFGQVDPCEYMDEAIKRAALELAGEIKIDTAIYDNHRIIRVANSFNAKGSLYKIEITYDELFSLTIDEIKELAKQPRDIKRKRTYRDILKNDLIERIVKSSFIIKENREPVDNGFFLPADKGNRNNRLFAQACVLFQKTTLHEKSITEIIKSINIASGDPLQDHEVNTIINSARSKRDSKEEEPLKITLITDMWQSFIESLREEENKLTLCFPSVDNVFKGKLRSKMGVILGYGGAKKSMYGQNVCYENIIRGCRCVYSNMEMGLNELTARFINIAIEGYSNGLYTDLIEKDFKAGRDVTRAIDHIISKFSDKLLIAENSNMTAAKYDELVDRITRERGKVDILIVDGMSMMGGSGTEVERANEHSKELKELAKKWNILVLPIVHVSRGDDLTTRDLTRRARGSEKIADNGDFFISLSQIKDGTDTYLPYKGYFHCWDKRGTGLRIEKQWTFNHDSLKMIEENEGFEQRYNPDF